MSKILLTGFEPFGKSSLNPSAEIVKRISGANIVTAILPVTYAQSAHKLSSLINQHKLDIVICLGQAEGRKEITPERVASYVRSALAKSRKSSTSRSISFWPCAKEINHCSSSPGGVMIPRLSANNQCASAIPKSVAL